MCPFAHPFDGLPCLSERPHGVNGYDEESVKAGALGLMKGAEFIEAVLGLTRGVERATKT